MPHQSIKIGLDFHGVINKRPNFFARFCTEALRRGHEIHIITGGPRHRVKQMLEKMGVKYTRLFAILDYYDARGEVTYFENGEYKVPDKLWDTAKAEYCSIHGINMHIDDSSAYVKWFQTPYCHYENDKQICHTENDFTIDFSASPLKAVAQIENIVSHLQFY